MVVCLSTKPRRVLADPEKYAPQYGGYCAWAVSEKKDFAPGDPQYWAIEDGKLYLNYNNKIKGLWEKIGRIISLKATKIGLR